MTNTNTSTIKIDSETAARIALLGAKASEVEMWSEVVLCEMALEGNVDALAHCLVAMEQLGI
jgi:hypothetical protein